MLNAQSLTSKHSKLKKILAGRTRPTLYSHVKAALALHIHEERVRALH